MAQLSKSSFKNLYGTSGTEFPDNTTAEISEGDMRAFGENLADSFMSLKDNFIDEDDMASDSATKAPSQQSVKAYVDAKVSGAGTSGTYTPTGTGISNVTGSTPSVFHYMRIGDVVHVSGAISIQTTGVGATEIEITLPVASNFANASECAGTGSNGANHGRISGDASNNRAEYAFTAGGATTSTHYLIFSYQVIS